MIFVDFPPAEVNRTDRVEAKASQPPTSQFTVTEATLTASADQVLGWEVWTPWTECYVSHESNQYERMRFKLCSLSDATGQHKCNHSLGAPIREQEIELSKS